MIAVLLLATALILCVVFAGITARRPGALMRGWLALRRWLRRREEPKVDSHEELRQLLDAAEDGGLIDELEQELAENAVVFADRMARDVMIPRPQIIALDLDQPLAEILEMVVAQPQTRYPVYRGEIDNVCGLLHSHDLLRALHRDGREAVSIEPLLRELPIIPETKRLGVLLTELQAAGQQLAVVVDEYGAVAGLVTMEDIVEELVGQIHDEFDRPLGARLSWISKNRLRVHGELAIDDLLKALRKRGRSIDLQQNGYQTVSGLVFGHLGRTPVQGDVVEHVGLTFTVRKTNGVRIERLEIVLPAED